MVGPCALLALGAHPDDVELGCGGLLARVAASGLRVGIVDLTAGETAARGTVEIRREEAGAASAALGAAWRECLGLPDGGLLTGDEAQIRVVVEAIRLATPHFMLLHHPGDPHPDHFAAAALARRAAFLAGVGGFAPELGVPHHPRLLLAFPGPRQLLAPDLVVDVTAWYDAKRRAVAAHRSQFDPGWQPTEGARNVSTHLSSPYFLEAVEGRDRAAGNVVGCEHGEGFAAVGPLAADELAHLLTAGRGADGTADRPCS